MTAFKTKLFHKWAIQEGLSDDTLQQAIDEIGHGLFEANLGGNIIKKRVALHARGKSGGARTLLAYRTEENSFFLYAFAKNTRANISDKELKSLKLMAKYFLSLKNKEIKIAIKSGELFEVKSDG